MCFIAHVDIVLGKVSYSLPFPCQSADVLMCRQWIETALNADEGRGKASKSIYGRVGDIARSDSTSTRAGH